MDEKEQGRADEQRGFGLARVGVVFLLLPVIYVLSLGPVLKFAPNALNSPVVNAIYVPLVAICDHAEPVAKFVYWYVDRFWKVHRDNYIY